MNAEQPGSCFISPGQACGMKHAHRHVRTSAVCPRPAQGSFPD
jgi:hypothetical protein